MRRPTADSPLDPFKLNPKVAVVAGGSRLPSSSEATRHRKVIQDESSFCTHVALRTRLPRHMRGDAS